MQRYRFNTRVCAPGETIVQFIAALRHLSEHCNYGDSLADMLRDRLVCGVNHEGIQRKLLSENNLTYDKAYELSVAVETAERDTRDLSKSRSATTFQNVFYNRDTSTRHPPHSPNFRNSNAQRHQPNEPISCYRCGDAHLANVCRFKDSVCRFCNKKGHLQRVCRSKARTEHTNRPIYRPSDHNRPYTSNRSSDSKRPSTPSTDNHRRSCHFADDQSDSESYGMFQLTDKPTCDPILLDVLINDIPVQMEMDAGASVSVISNSTYLSISSKNPLGSLQHSQLKLKTYTGESIDILGCISVKVSYNNCELVLPVYVVAGKGPNLMGRDWLSQLNIGLNSLNCLDKVNPPLNEVLQRHSSLYNDELGCLQAFDIKLNIDEKIQPKFFKPRSVPFAIKKMVENEIVRLQERGIITPIKFSSWAAPIVPVIKKDSSVRICGDYKVTANRAILVDSYPLPRVDVIFSNLAGGKYFSKLDMSNAYLQLPLDETSQHLVTINTHKGYLNIIVYPLVFRMHLQSFSDVWKPFLVGKKVLQYTLMIYSLLVLP